MQYDEDGSSYIVLTCNKDGYVSVVKSDEDGTYIELLVESLVCGELNNVIMTSLRQSCKDEKILKAVEEHLAKLKLVEEKKVAGGPIVSPLIAMAVYQQLCGVGHEAKST